jgi:hypothetical protein
VKEKATVTASKSTTAVISTYNNRGSWEKTVGMQSRHVGNAIVLSTALFVAVVTSMLATSAFAQTKSKLTVLSETDPSADGARRFVVHSALVGRDFVVVVSPPPIFGSWVSADLKAAGSKQLDQKLPAIYALDAGYGIDSRRGRHSLRSPACQARVNYWRKLGSDSSLLWDTASCSLSRERWMLRRRH